MRGPGVKFHHYIFKFSTVPIDPKFPFLNKYFAVNSSPTTQLSCLS